ncbi:hypothetical protein [Parasphingorhabdus sp.]|uniref:hypothetical protein n=1 Tax=Parasphingorhabdus sp. TaxID=2709688 RepID=UPI003A8EA43B
MKLHLLALATAAIAISAPGAALAKHHDEGHEGHKMEKMEDGTMKCCMTDADGKEVCHMMDTAKMDHSKMDHSKMDQSKMDHSKMANPETPDAEPN